MTPALWILVLGVGTGLAKALLAVERPRGTSWQEWLLLPLRLWSAPFWGAFLLFWSAWPGALDRPAILGSLLVVAGLAFLFFSLLMGERARYPERNLLKDVDPWGLPPDLQPLGARWGWREEWLTALVLAPSVAAVARGQAGAGGLLFGLQAWLGLILPVMGFRLLVALLHRRRHERNGDGPGWYFRPRLFRSLVGLSCLGLVASGGWVCYQGIIRLTGWMA